MIDDTDDLLTVMTREKAVIALGAFLPQYLAPGGLGRSSEAARSVALIAGVLCGATEHPAWASEWLAALGIRGDELTMLADEICRHFPLPSLWMGTPADSAIEPQTSVLPPEAPDADR